LKKQKTWPSKVKINW